MALPATASPLLQMDLLAPGDGLITYDSVTGLQWLDVRATAGLSYNQVRAGQFYTSYGFAHASDTQVSTFVADAVPSPWVAYFWTEEEMRADPYSHEVLELYRLWGGAGELGISWSYQSIEGILSNPYREWDPEQPPTHEWQQYIFRFTHETEGDPYYVRMRQRIGIDSFPGDDTAWGGHFLVRAIPSVPDGATTLWLLIPATGLLFLSRQRSRVAAGSRKAD